MWEALEVAQAADFVRGHARRARGPHRAGRHQRVAAGSASACRSPGPWCASPRSTCSTTRSRRSTSPPTRGCAPRSRPYTRDAAVLIVAQRVSTIATADEILVLEDGEIVGPRHPRRADRDLPHLRRDRAVADRRAERGMTTSTDSTTERRRGDEVDLAGARDRGAAGRWHVRRRPHRAVEGLRRRRCAGSGRLLGPERPRPASVVARRWPIVSAVLNVLGPAGARARHRHHRRRAFSRGGDRLRRAPPRAARARRRSTSARCVLSILAGVAPRRRRPAARCSGCATTAEDKVNAPAAELHRPAAARRPAEPGHQRHRQPRPEPAADDEPDAHVGAAAHRRRGHDVHDLAAAGGGRAHHRAAVGAGR